MFDAKGPPTRVFSFFFLIFVFLKLRMNILSKATEELRNDTFLRRKIHYRSTFSGTAKIILYFKMSKF
jgi:hypothetical protein